MKYLIVNADDFGYSYGINKGIVEAIERGIVTSTSVMVDAIAAPEASELSKFKDISVGLHLVITDPDSIDAELARQVEKFESIVGHRPDHVDTHKSKPDSKEQIRAALAKYATTHKTPIRRLGYAKFIESFFAMKDGTLDESRVSMEGFKSALHEATDEFNELMCHVGYSDDYLRKTSTYNDIRENELAVILDPEAREYLKAQGLTLCSWNLAAQKKF